MKNRVILLGALSVATVCGQQSARERYIEQVRSWADVRFTPAEIRDMNNGKQWEPLMTKGPDDPLAKRILAAGEPSFDALSSYYPGKILDRTVLGTYSDPNDAEPRYSDEFAIYWNGAIAANLIKAGGRPVAHDTVVVFRVGADREIMGTDRTAFQPFHYEDGYLPVVTGGYTKDGIRYRETVLASKPVDGPDVAYVDFELTNLAAAKKEAMLATDIAADARLTLASKQTAHVNFKIPYLPDGKGLVQSISHNEFETQAEHIRRFWKELLARGVQIEVPEERVNNVWRALLLQNFVLADGPRFTYGSGLVYNDSTFPQENGFGAHVFAMYGFPDYADALQRNFIGMCVTLEGAGRKYQNRRAMVFHHLLEDYRLTGKRDLFDRYKADYYRVAEEIISDRRATGLLPPDKPGVDVQASTQTVIVLGHNITNCQGLLDFGRFLVVTGIDPERGNRYLREGADFRKILMDTMRRAAIRIPGRPPFVDLQTLNFRETPDYGPDPYDDLALGRLQGTYFHYWVDMQVHYNFFNPEDDVGQWLADYVQQRNGFVLGCTRARSETDPRFGWINNVYDAGYYDYRLRRGETDRFLLGLYSRLAFGMTRNLYVASEGSPFIGYNTQKGGFVGAEYSFPNSASNADTLLMLRNALAFEELHDNVETGKLVLLSGAPKAWFEAGKSIRVSKLPTYFGALAFDVTSSTDGRTLTATVQPPDCRQVVVHLRRPNMKNVTVNGSKWQDADLAHGIVTLPGGMKRADIKVTF
jgi:hypothetical protein